MNRYSAVSCWIIEDRWTDRYRYVQRPPKMYAYFRKRNAYKYCNTKSINTIEIYASYLQLPQLQQVLKVEPSHFQTLISTVSCCLGSWSHWVAAHAMSGSSLRASSVVGFLNCTTSARVCPTRVTPSVLKISYYSRNVYFLFQKYVHTFWQALYIARYWHRYIRLYVIHISMHNILKFGFFCS